MKLVALRAELAVMNILSEHRLHPDDEISRSTLVASWRRYGMRGSDLTRAMTRLQAMGLIELRGKRGHRNVALTPTGAKWLRSPRGKLSRLLLVPRYLRIQLAQFVALEEPVAATSRRTTDHPPRET